MQVYLVQMQSIPGNKEKNLEKARQRVIGASPAPESLILFPEMFATGYIPEQAEELAEDFEKGLCHIISEHSYVKRKRLELF